MAPLLVLALVLSSSAAAESANVGLAPLVAAPAFNVTVTTNTTIHYASSVDGWNLSYAEWLPTNYSSSATYPLLIYLHGQQDISGAWFRGGLTNDLFQYLNASSYDGIATRAFINTFATHGFITIALNTRSGAGWYIDSPCGGPQQQDVMDAIAHEAALRHVGLLYLAGTSMGTEGVLYTAASHPGMFSGVAIISPVTDLFEDVSYRMHLQATANATDPWAYESIQAKEHLFCGILPGNGSAAQQSAARMFENMSPLRFNPAAFRNLPLYSVVGGQDDRTPNNVALWPGWLNVNNTFVNSTCSIAAQLGEPPNCNTPFVILHNQDPTHYAFRCVFDPKAAHGLSALNASDLLSFWMSPSLGGFDVANGWPPGPVVALGNPYYAPPPPPSFEVDIEETGLAPGTPWSVVAAGVSYQPVGPSLQLSMPNGTYALSVARIPGYQLSSPETVVVNGSAVSIDVVFTPIAFFPVTFLETGLTNGTPWSVTVNGSEAPSTNSTVQVDLSNGTYDYAVAGPAGFQLVPGGSITLNGSALTVEVEFYAVEVFNLTFTTDGLPSGAVWGLTLGGSAFSSNTSLLALQLPNGTYDVTYSGPTGYVATGNGSVEVLGAPQSLIVEFTLALFPVNFSEAGLAAGTTWSISVGPVTASASAPTLYVNLPNGTFAYNVTPVGGYLSPVSGIVTVAGAPVEVVVTFFQIETFAATFTETGLPGSSLWGVTVNGTTVRSGSPSLSYNLTNGTYAYTVSPIPGFQAASWAGSLVVAGNAVTTSLSFTPYTVSVTFSEQGLTSGTSWSVTVGGATRTSSTSSIVVMLPNGTFSYSVGSVVGYKSPGSGSVSVVGIPAGVSLRFTVVTNYVLKFTESGLPGGTHWAVTAGGHTTASTTTSISFSAPNGNFTYSVGSVAGYVASPRSGTGTINGAALTIPIVFTAVTYQVTFTESGLASGTSWKVTIGSTSVTSVRSTAVFALANKTYTYTVGTVSGYTSPPGGSVVVNGAPVGVALSFHKVVNYPAKFTETGLPKGTTWSVTLGPKTVTANGTSITLNVPNGTYAFSVSARGYAGTPAVGNVTIAGAGTTTHVSFTSSGAVRAPAVAAARPSPSTMSLVGAQSIGSPRVARTADPPV